LAQAQARPSLAACARVLAKLLDGRAHAPKAAAAKQLVDIMNRLNTGSDLRKSRLSVVRTMTIGNNSLANPTAPGK
jgi:hypothetical protein